MRIGGAGVTAQTESYGSRQSPQGPQVPFARSTGLPALADAFRSAGGVADAYISQRMREEQEAEDYNDVLRKNKFEGEWQREAEELKTGLPADGRGYVGTLEDRYKSAREDFIKTISPRNRQKYNAWAEGLWQNTAISGDAYTRQQTRANSVHTLGVATNEAQMRVYENPDDLSPMDSVTELVNAAPGLTEVERLERIRVGNAQIGAAAIAGQVRDTRIAAYSVPNSADVRLRVMPALIDQESGGNPNAESPKGASGLAQVMPDTGLEIARELGDQNFPFKGSTEDRKAYLKHPDVSVRYGEYYLNKMLKRYGGDLELALIGYNAGPDRADMFKASGRQWSALPPGVQSETKAYVESIFAKVGATTPDQVFDPAYGLTFDQALIGEAALQGAFSDAQTLAQGLLDKAMKDAEAIATQQAKAAEQAHSAMMADLYRQTEFEGLNFPVKYQELVQNGLVVYDESDANKGRVIYERVNEKALAYQGAVDKIIAGENLSGEEGDLYIPGPLLQQVENLQPEAMDQVTQLVDEVGFIPPQTKATLERMVYSGDMRQVNAAAQMITAIQQNNPTYSDGLSQDAQARASAYEALRAAGYSEDAISDRMQSTRTPEGRAALARLKETDDGYKDAQTLSAQDISGEFNNWFRRNLPGLPVRGLSNDPSANALLQMQYNQLFEAVYASTWDADIARETAIGQVKKQWGVTEVGQPQIMHLPPETALRNIKIDLDGDGQLDNVELEPAYIRERFNRGVKEQFGFPDDMTFTVKSTPATQAAIEDGRPVPYFVIPTDAEGNPSFPVDQPDLYFKVFNTPFEFTYQDITKKDAEYIQQLSPLYRERERLEQVIRNSGNPMIPDAVQPVTEAVSNFLDPVGNTALRQARERLDLIRPQIEEIEKEMRGE